jgi:GNAT superfamily N-acetyltransferase
MTNVSIRVATQADADAVIGLVAEFATHENARPPDFDARIRFKADGWGLHPRFRSLIAEISGIPVGLAIVVEKYSTFQARPTLYLEDLFVRPSHRSHGVGTILIQFLESKIRNGEYARLEWTCPEDNVRAHKLYKKLGACRLRKHSFCLAEIQAHAGMSID